MERRELGRGGPRVSALGLGCMGMTPIYGEPDPVEAEKTLHAAIDAGVTMIDTADAYANGKNESFLGKALAGRRDAVFLCTKFGNMRFPDGSRGVNGHPDYVPEACDKSLERLGVEVIDLLYLHRVDPTVPIEDTVGAMARLIEAGKVRFLGLSEAGAQTIQRANATHKITALQTEYSLASRDVEEEILPICRDLGIGFVAYAPLGRGLLTGAIRDLEGLSEKDRRRDMPRFQGGNLAHNLALLKGVEAVAARHGCSNAAVALAWLLSRGPDILAIPGCKRRETLTGSLAALDVTLDAEDLSSIEQSFDTAAVRGTRYPEKQMARLGL